jgi:Polyketide synthase dehydratase
MHDVGYSFGTIFQKHLEAEPLCGTRQSRSYVSLSEPQEEYQQSYYPMHPVCIDGSFQTVGPSLWKGDRSTVTSVLVPAMIDNLIINERLKKPEVGISVTSSKYVGVGRPEDTKNYMSDASVYDPETGLLLMELSGLRYSKLDTREDPHAAHSYSRVDWKPDITLTKQDQVLGLRNETTSNDSKDDQLPMTFNQVIDMIAHKKPNLRVMEFQMAFPDLESLWLEGNGWFDNSYRSACSQYCFASMDAAVLIEAGERYKAHRNMECVVLDLTKPPNEDSPSATDFDLVIVKLVRIAANMNLSKRPLPTN